MMHLNYSKKQIFACTWINPPNPYFSESLSMEFSRMLFNFFNS